MRIKFSKIADDCGLYIEEHDPSVTSKEIEFFAEQIVKYAIPALKDDGWSVPYEVVNNAFSKVG